MHRDEPNPLTVLVVEDDVQMRRLLALMLQRHGFAVLKAATARQGLEVADRWRHAIDLAIVDMVMPGMSGLDLAAEFGRNHLDIKVLYISGYVASIAMQAIADRTPEAVLLKPFTEDRLIERVQHLLGVREYSPDFESVPPTQEGGWEGLMEASDAVGHPYRIASYRDTIIGYSIAAVHAAVLRQADLAYSFQMQRDADFPFDLVVESHQWQRARDAIAVAGLSADIAVAA